MTARMNAAVTLMVFPPRDDKYERVRLGAEPVSSAELVPPRALVWWGVHLRYPGKGKARRRPYAPKTKAAKPKVCIKGPAAPPPLPKRGAAEGPARHQVGSIFRVGDQQ